MEWGQKIAGEVYGRSPAMGALADIRQYNAIMVGRIARMEWKVRYRKMRILRREHSKATMDALMFGTGAVFIGDDGSIRHVPISELQELKL